MQKKLVNKKGKQPSRHVFRANNILFVCCCYDFRLTWTWFPSLLSLFYARVSRQY